MGTFRRHILAPAFYLNVGDGVLISSCAWCLHPHTIERSALIDHHKVSPSEVALGLSVAVIDFDVYGLLLMISPSMYV